MRAGYALVRILGPSAVTAIVRSACAAWLLAVISGVIDSEPLAA